MNMASSVTSEKVDGDFDYLQNYIQSLNLSAKPTVVKSIATTSAASPEKKKKSVNPYTKAPYSKRYYQLLEDRKKLPVTEYKDKFMALLETKQIIIIVGETGSGKTTQIPQWCVEYLKGESGVVCTQPRRVTATSMAKRVSEEMDVHLGQHVGYCIGYEPPCTSLATLLCYMTDGRLLREAMTDRLLPQYQVILLDEAHIRSRDTDVLMGLLKKAILARSELRLVIMSATLDEEKFQNYFKDAAMMLIPGRTHDVKINHSTKYEAGGYVVAAVNKVIEIHRMERTEGDILVFLPGQEEIEDACNQIEAAAAQLGSTYGDLTILPLFSALPPDQQQLVFEPVPRSDGFGINRKVVVATNVAETSLTIDGVTFVVDPGYVKEKVYNHTTRGESLQVVRISQASANQRSGRAGRTCNGTCYRLYYESVYDKMDKFTQPSILNSNMGSVILQLKCMGIPNVLDFDFMDKPDPEIMQQAVNQLQTLKALDEDGNVTELGELISRFPLDPPVAKMLIKSCEYNCTQEILTIAAMLSVQNCFTGNKKTRTKANAAIEQFRSAYGDHVRLMNVYNEYKNNYESQRWCRANFVNYRVLKAAHAVRTQLCFIVKRIKLFEDSMNAPSNDDATYTNLRKVLCIGFFNQVALKYRRFQYRTTQDNQTVFLHPSTCLNKEAGPPFLLYHEQVTTNKDYIRVCTPIEVTWLDDSGSDSSDSGSDSSDLLYESD